MAEITFCNKCGGKNSGTGGGYAHKENCPYVTKAMQEIIGTPMQGWQCPTCQRVYAPTVGMCSTCGPKTVASDTSGPIEHL